MMMYELDEVDKAVLPGETPQTERALTMNDRIDYEDVESRRGSSDVMRVKLDGRTVGVIRLVEGGFTYVPKGQKKGGAVFRTVRELQRDIEGDSTDRS